jgi:phosphate acetyltransferase
VSESIGADSPTSFEAKLQELACANPRTIVLPEATEERILRAADIVLRAGIAKIVLLGKADLVKAKADALGLDLSAAQIVDMEDPELAGKCASEYAHLRARKGVTLEQAAQKMKDGSYFGTMMVHLGLADGMVSGAVNTTANTIRPSLEFIKTKPGVSVVSGSFLMVLGERVDVYADCAVNPNPTPQQLADITISTAQTAVKFGIEPKVAILSYSTGESAVGPDVDAAREATMLARQLAPELPIEGPIQFDAACDQVVAKTKLPDSPVAGKANVFIFPDLNAGNITYKAVQRTSGAIAIGPVLQGLNKPVNDLSRGALIRDIVNTIAFTCIQAQG